MALRTLRRRAARRWAKRDDADSVSARAPLGHRDAAAEKERAAEAALAQ